MMQTDEMDFASLGERKRAIFCVIPVNDGSMNYLVSMLMTQCFQQLYLRADERYNGRLPIPVRVIQDEWANVAQPDSYPKVLATCRSYNIGINIIVLLFVLYFMLIGGLRMEGYCREILPFNRDVGSSVMREVHMIVRSNAIGIPLLAVVQGVVAFVGYLVFNAPSPLFWGVLTCFATIIPIFGTALIWLPLAGYMALTGDWGPAIGLLLYGGLVVTHVDNVVRFIMQKKMADTHPLVTIFGVFIGLSLFGFMGVIFGPLMLEMFVFCVNIFKKKYLDGTSYKQLFVPEQDIQA